jgi:hypothetical protein
MQNRGSAFRPLCTIAERAAEDRVARSGRGKESDTFKIAIRLAIRQSSRGAPAGCAGAIGRNCKVTETMEAGRSGRTSPQPSRFLVTTAGRLLGVVAGVVLIVGTAIGSYFLARAAGDSEIRASNIRIVELQSENQKLNADNTNKLVAIADLQSQLKSVQAKLAVIMPSENTYNISPNQSMIVAGGRLTIGLIGSPTNESVNININGKQQSAVAGAIFNSVLDPSTTCEVGVQSFDMFKAVLTASCAAAKPQ